jgi:hypothetical protein
VPGQQKLFYEQPFYEQPFYEQPFYEQPFYEQDEQTDIDRFIDRGDRSSVP